MIGKKMNLIKQAMRFFLTSGIGWIIDFFVYGCLLLITNQVLFSNMISSFCGVTFVFVVSTRKTFALHQSRLSLKAKYLLYLFYQIALILVASIVMDRLNVVLMTSSLSLAVRFSKLGAKVIVTPFTMVLNFIVMKLLIEKI